MLLRRLVVVGLVGFVSFAANIATAEDAVAPNASFAVDGVSFADPTHAFGQDRLRLDFNSADPNRFASLGESGRKSVVNTRDYELALVARSAAGFDVAFAQRRGLGFNTEGDIARESRASELRLGNGLRNMRRDQPMQEARWYIFAASEDEALVWQPGARSEFGGSGDTFSLQDRVEIGDLQAGITYERYGFQTSLAYVEREVNVYAGNQSFKQDEGFTGLTLTYRH